jgi:hypothetical protein
MHIVSQDIAPDLTGLPDEENFHFYTFYRWMALPCSSGIILVSLMKDMGGKLCQLTILPASMIIQRMNNNRIEQRAQA